MLPPSVTKIKTKQGKCEIEFVSSVDRVKYTMHELIRRANMDVGKYLVRLIRAKVKAEIPITKRAKYMPQRYQYWARKQENDLQIGVENTKYGAETAWWADQAELGLNGQPKRGFIRSTVEEHIDDIRSIQAKYISAIEDEMKAQQLVSESESEADEPDVMEDE